MINVPEEIRSGVKVDGNKIYVLSIYRSSPLFLSFKKSYEETAGKVDIAVISAEEMQEISTPKAQSAASDSRIVNIYKRMFYEASGRGASDIHIILFNGSYTDVFFRVHGKLLKHTQITHEEGNAVMRSIYQNISTSDVSYRENEYQSGQIHLFDDVRVLPENVLSIRIQRGPILNGSYMVLRLLYREKKEKETSALKIGQVLLKKELITAQILDEALKIQQELKNKGRDIKLGDILVNNGFIGREQLEDALSNANQKASLNLGLKIFKDYGYTEEQALILAKAARQPLGMVIFSGPTGSGKSTALKIALEFQSKMYPDKSIYTIEDPPEYPITGAKQLPVLNAGTDEKRGSKFAEGLRVAMRSDPDILMVGEIRDEATANVAFDAVITGHQMWTTIHAADVFSIILRLARFNLNKEDLYDEKLLNVLVGQRLLPKLCDCKIDYHGGSIDYDLDNMLSPFSNGIKLKNPSGCDKCGNTGISGRVIVAEVVDMDKDIINEIKEYGITAARRRFNETGFTMIKHAVQRLLIGEVDPRDVISVVGNITPESLSGVAYGI